MNTPDPKRPSSPFDAFEDKKKEDLTPASVPAQKKSIFKRIKQFAQFKFFSPGTDLVEEKKEKTSDFVKTVLSAFLIAIFIRSFLFQPFSIPSESMLPSLLVGDYLFVNKFHYGFSRYSLPFGFPLFSGRVLASNPERGDVVVFRVPLDGNKDYIKRVIGLPGDRIRIEEGRLFINDKPISRLFIGNYQGATSTSNTVSAEIYRETLPNGVSYLTLDAVKGMPYDDTRDYIIPEGHYFMMGDNRDNSQDSRYINGFVGFVPFENIIGKAEIVFFSLNTQQSGGTQGKGSYLRFDRLLHWIE